MNIKKLIDKIFELGIVIKSIFGFFEILAGILLSISGQALVDNLILSVARQEIIEDPHDFVLITLIKVSNSFYTTGHIFAVLYLIFHGVINIFLAIALLKNKIWAYLWALVGFGLFVIYQIYRYSHTHSLLLLSLTLFDIFFVFIIFLEYKRKFKKRADNL